MSTLRKSQMTGNLFISQYYYEMIVSHCYLMLWITYTHISKKNSGKNLPIYVQVYYSFVDGIHIGEFVDSLEKYFANL